MSLSDLLDKDLGNHIEATNELRYTCPFCGSPKQKFYINSDPLSDKFGLWICYNCEEHGNLASLYMRLHNVSYEEANRALFAEGISLDTLPYDPSLSNNENIMLTLGAKHLNSQSKTTVASLKPPSLPYGLQYLTGTNSAEKPYWDYLEGRGFRKKLIVSLGTGYINNGYTYNQKGQKVILNHHVVFFTYDDSGNYVYWNTRAIDNSVPKSVNAPKSENSFSREDVLFGANYAFEQKLIVITEGVPDALTLFPYGVATFGKQVTQSQIDLILDKIKPEQKLLVMLDMDAAPLLADLGAKLYGKHKNTFLVYNPTNKDANSLGRNKALELLKHHLYLANQAGRIAFKLTTKHGII